MSPWALWLCMILFIGTGIAVDVPFVFDEKSSDVSNYTSSQLEKIHISSPDLAGVPIVTQVADKDVLDFPITGGGNIPMGTIEKNVGDLKKTLDAAVEPDNSRVHEEAVVLALKYPGDLTIDQIASIYSYLKNGDGTKKGWGYVRDPRGIDYFNYANASLKLGDRANCVGGGDCDDFAILMSALVESIGGTTRIILARNNITGGHAYTEVYLGQLGTQGSQVEDIISWLKEKFDTDMIYTHIDTDAKEVWLNLDWGADEKGNAHPGGPFYQGNKHIVLCIRDRYEKAALRLPYQSRSEIVFDDPNLEAVIRENVSKIEGVIYPEDLKGLDNLNASAKNIKTIAGLDHCTNLKTLRLRDNQIVDVSPLSGLTKLEQLDLARNKITDLSPLSGLTKLEQLDLEDNQITDISPLSGLIKLEYLYLEDNQITDISPLSGLTSLILLYLWDNQITDISLLSGLTKLEHLFLEGNQIVDVSPLSGLTKLEQLDLARNKITDISPLSSLTSLNGLILRNNQITDVSPLSSLTSLNGLILWNNQITDVSPLLGLTNLSAEAWNDMGAALGRQGKQDEALKAYDKAIEQKPGFADAWNNKGWALFCQSKLKEAIQAYNKATDLDPKNLTAWINKGAVLYSLGRYDEALQAYDRALKIDPKDAIAWNNKGTDLQKLGRTTEAEAAFAKAKKLGFLV